MPDRTVEALADALALAEHELGPLREWRASFRLGEGLALVAFPQGSERGRQYRVIDAGAFRQIIPGRGATLPLS